MSSIIKVISLTRSKRLYNVLFSNNELLEATEELVVKHRLVKGRELSYENFENIKNEASWFKYFDIALNYLQKGAKSAYLIKIYLQKKGASHNEIENVIGELYAHNLLNDASYFKDLADHYIRNGFGPLYLKKKGMENGISEKDINNVLKDIPNEVYLEYAKDVFKRKKATMPGKDLADKLKIKRYMLGRGYTYEIVDKVCEDIL